MTDAAAPKVWFITGCSSGLGRELALVALARGDHVVATARNVATLAELEQRGALALALDVTWTDAAVNAVVSEAVRRFGRVDILVNNAAYSLVGGIEECGGDEIAAVFDANVFGIFRTVRAVMPHMRAQRSGVIANIGSIGGRKGFPASGVYCTTKFAVAGLSETLREEVAHLGIEVTCVDLGWLRTPFIDNFVRAKAPLGDAGPVVASMKKEFAAVNGQQPGDPVKVAKVLADALTKSGRCAGRERLPVRLSIGSETVQFVTDVLERDQRELHAWADAMSGTDFGDDAPGSVAP